MPGRLSWPFANVGTLVLSPALSFVVSVTNETMSAGCPLIFSLVEPAGFEGADISIGACLIESRFFATFLDDPSMLINRFEEFKSSLVIRAFGIDEIAEVSEFSPLGGLSQVCPSVKQDKVNRQKS